MELTPFQNSLSRGATASECFVSSGFFWQPLKAIKSTCCLHSAPHPFSLGSESNVPLCRSGRAGGDNGGTALACPVTGELVTLYFKAMHCYKEELCHGATAGEAHALQSGQQQGVGSLQK